jgi:hypothetical protein
MTFEEVKEYFRRGRIENPIFPADYELAGKPYPKAEKE